MGQKIKPWLPVIVWMVFIFTLSTGFGASNHTSRFIEPFLHWLLPHARPETIDLLHTLIRKCGHLSEYAILALLVRRAAMRSGWFQRQNLRIAGFALLFAAIYAATDEFHQSFVPGRGSSPIDVLIDSCGACAALTVTAAWNKSRTQRLADDPVGTGTGI